MKKHIVGKYLDFVQKRRKIIIISMILLIGYFGFMLSKLQLDLTTEGFLFPNDPKIKQYRQFQSVFGNDVLGLVAVKGDVFTREYLSRLYELQKDLEEKVPYVKETMSIINVAQIYSETDETGVPTLVVEDLLKNYPEKPLSDYQIERLHKTLTTDPIYNNQFISSDQSTTTILVRMYSGEEIAAREKSNTIAAEDIDFDNLDSLFDDSTVTEIDNNTDEAVEHTRSLQEGENLYLTNSQNKEVYKAMTEVSNIHESKDFDISIVGPVLFIPVLFQSLIRDVIILLPILIVMVLIFMLLMFKRRSAILFTMITVGFTNLSMIGLMTSLGVKLTMVTNVLPMIMIGIVLGAVVHLLVLVYGKYDGGYEMIDAIKYTFEHSSWPIILTSLTSAAGIFSFYFSSIKPMRDFGVFGALALLFALVCILLFLPALLLTLPIKRKPLDKHKVSLYLDKILTAHSHIAYKYRLVTILISIIIVAVAIMGVKHVQFSHKPIDWLPKNSQFKQDTLVVDKVLNGSNFLDLYIDTGEKGTVYEPSFLRKLDELEKYILAYDKDGIKSGKVMSLNVYVKKTNMILHEEKDEFYTIPDSRDLVAQELLLIENSGSDMLTNVADLNYRYARISMTLPDLDAVYFDRFLIDLDEKMTEIFSNDDYHFYSTGWVALLAKIINSTILSAKTSYMIAFIVITILMILLTKNITIGLVSMIPNLLPIFVLLAVIGYTSINLDMFVLLIGCVLVGIAVDNTIHFVHIFSEYVKKGNDSQKAIQNTFLTSGKAMVTSSVILMAGFSVLIFADMRNFHNFGLLAVIGVLCALFADFFLTPALMTYMHKWNILKFKNKTLPANT